MKEIYNQQLQEQQHQEKLQEESKKSLETITNELATEIESQNYFKAKDALSKIEKAVFIQKNTTDTLKLQGEKMKKIKEESLNVLRNAENASEVSHIIKQESSIFPGFGTLFRGIKKWWMKDRKMKRDVDQIKNRQIRIINQEEIEDEVFEPLEDEQIKGENKTDEQLNKILNGIRKIRQEAKTQIEIIKDQSEEIKDIEKLDDFTKKIVNQTEKEVRK